MAEIFIKKKSKSPVWLWILGILVIVAIIVWLIFRNDTSNTQPNQSGNILNLRENSLIALKSKNMTQIPGIVSLKLETFMA